MSEKRTVSLFRPWVIVTILCVIYVLAVVITKGSPLALVTPGADFAPDDIPYTYSDEGYDGQFVYYIASDPAQAADFIDVPAYRYQRILLPIAGTVLSLGQNTLIPWALLAVSLIALAGGTALLERLLVEYRVSRWYAIGYGLSLGVLGAARLTTTETLAYALVLAGIILARRERWFWSGVLFALAILSKETAALFVGGYGLYLLSQRRWQTAMLLGVVAIVPFAIWQMVLYTWLGEFGIGSGGALATSFEILPFWGFVQILLDGGPGIFLLYLLIVTPFVILPAVWGLVQCWRDARQRRFEAITWLLLVNALVMLFVPYSTYREFLGILRFIVGLQIVVILYAAQRRQHRVLRYSTFWMMTTLMVIFSDFSGG